MQRLLLASLLLAVVVTVRPAYADIVYDANAEFLASVLSGTPDSPTFGPGGVFTVGFGNTIVPDITLQTPGAFTPFDSTEFVTTFAGNPDTSGFRTVNSAIVPAALIGTGPGTGFSNLAVGEILLHPGGRSGDSYAPPILNGVLRFVAPTSGDYTVVGNFRSIDSGRTLNLIGLNGEQIFSAIDPANSPFGTTYLFDMLLTLNAGDMLDFGVDFGGTTIDNDSTGLTAVITAVPEPGTWAMLALGGVGLWTSRRWRRKSGETA